MRPVLAQFMADRYPAIKAEYPGKGRRWRQLRVLSMFWENPPNPDEPLDVPSESVTSTFTQDDDPSDQILSDVVGGLVVRTDFENEDAWNVFTSKLKEAEDDITSGSLEADPEVVEDQDDSDDSDDEESTEGKLLKVINPELTEERVILNKISNLQALRLFNDLDIRLAPPVPSGTKRISTPNSLVDFSGYQEIYSGLTLWIYDAQSNLDQSVRLVSAEGDIYGTATGDSWRAQVSHIPDLQFNMTFSNMKINFGGQDRWDLNERQRNLEEVRTPLPM